MTWITVSERRKERITEYAITKCPSPSIKVPAMPTVLQARSQFSRLNHSSPLHRHCIATASPLRRRCAVVCRECVLTWRLPFYDKRPREIPGDGVVVTSAGDLVM